MDEDIRELFSAIDMCHTHGLITPTAALIYVAIDTLSWMKYGTIENSSKKRFTLWSDEYIKEFFDENCSAIDLYSARCATLHSMSAESSLSSSGLARQVLHVSGKNSADIPKIASKSLSKVGTTCIHIDTLIKELKIGAAMFFEKSEACEQTMQHIDHARQKQLVKMPVDLFEKILPFIDKT